ncbi:MAG TPA: LysE family transporter, partial [Microlunatus sp.]|nr:LysE family transporter [Microlunatus sp.]
MATLLAGFGMGLSLIVAIGAQNSYLLRQAIRRDRAMAVAAICIGSDVLLILLGVAGIGIVVRQAPVIVDALRWIGAAFLIGYGLLAARRAAGPEQRLVVGAGGSSAGRVIVTALALTWLNPHVYLDTV